MYVLVSLYTIIMGNLGKMVALLCYIRVLNDGFLFETNSRREIVTEIGRISVVLLLYIKQKKSI